MSKTEQVDVESLLTVGCPVVFHSNPLRVSAPKFTTWVRGWRKKAYILLDKPRVGGRNAVIHESQACAIQFVATGCVCQFPSTVFDWDTRAHNAFCRIAWPEHTAAESFRKQERVSLASPCQIHLDGAVLEGCVSDVSTGGCRFSAAEPLPMNTQGRISLVLPDGHAIDEAEFVVRGVQQAGGGTFAMGVEFAPGQTLVESGIAFFVLSSTGRAHPGTSDSDRMLVIDSDAQVGGALCEGLRNRGYESYLASGLIDGFYRLHSGSFRAVLVSQALEPVDGTMLCRVVQASGAFPDVLLYGYGGSGADVSDQMKAAGVREYFAPGTEPARIVEVVAQADQASRELAPDEES